MKFNYNWLKEYVKKLPPPYELAMKLTMSGLEVETVDAMDKGIGGVVTAQVLSVEKHPNADRLSLCKVKTDIGIHSIVCGAKNMQKGDIVALALPGAILPGNIKIKKTNIRGIESEGMMCSETELGLKDISQGIMILPHSLPIGKDFTEAMGLDDFVFDIKVTTNRSDCMSVIGLAREISAITNCRVKINKRSQFLKNKAKNTKQVNISLLEPSLCKRYSACVIENITIAPSPEWLKSRLESSGFRSINNVVDITNYVMMEYGQPMHAFDYDLISGKQIIVRTANENEKIQTIDGVERMLTKEMLVIADKDNPVALAGVMGGKQTEIIDTSKNILLESAFFDPFCVRRTSKKLGINTESSYRFERGVDVDGVTKALEKATKMIVELAGGTISTGVVDIYPQPYKPSNVKVELSRINKTLGINFAKEDIEGFLKRLDIGFKLLKLRNKEDAAWDIAPPSFRIDIHDEADIIEEIARLYGYEKIPATPPKAQLSTATIKVHDLIIEKVRDVLANNGFFEVINYSFISHKYFGITSSEIRNALKLKNPLTEEQSVMRNSLIPGLLQTLQYNLNHNNHDIKIFEIGRIFIPAGKVTSENDVEEKNVICGLFSGLRFGENWNTEKVRSDFYDIKGVTEQILNGLKIDRYIFTPITNSRILHIGKASVIAVDGKNIGIVGEIHPDIRLSLDIKQPAYIFELDMNIIAGKASGLKKYTPLPQYPMIVRDVSMIIDKETTYQTIYNAIKELGIKLLDDVNVFDVYYGDNIPTGKYSIALRFLYCSLEKTLTDNEVNDIHTAVLNELKAKFEIEIRGEEVSV